MNSRYSRWYKEINKVLPGYWKKMLWENRWRRIGRFKCKKDEKGLYVSSGRGLGVCVGKLCDRKGMMREFIRECEKFKKL